MSYCRWTNSDIFLYPDDEGAIICFECQLEEDVPNSRYFYSRKKALAHVEKHLAFGDNVPEQVVDTLREEIETKGDAIKEEYEYTRRFTGDV